MKSFFDKLKADDSIHIRSQRNQHSWVHGRHLAEDPTEVGAEIEKNAMRALAVVENLFNKQFPNCFVASLLFHVVADKIEGNIGAATRREKSANRALTAFTGTEIEWQKSMRHSIGKENFFAHRGESATHCGNQTGLAGATCQGENYKHRSARFLQTDRCRLNPVRLCLFEHAFQGEPARGHTFARRLQSVCLGQLRDRRCGSNRRSGRSVNPRWTRVVSEII